jgi:hypothetical protein
MPHVLARAVRREDVEREPSERIEMSGVAGETCVTGVKLNDRPTCDDMVGPSLEDSVGFGPVCALIHIKPLMLRMPPRS